MGSDPDVGSIKYLKLTFLNEATCTMYEHDKAGFMKGYIKNAMYGSDGKMVPVNVPAFNHCIEVENKILGCDPAYGNFKKLVITFH